MTIGSDLSYSTSTQRRRRWEYTREVRHDCRTTSDSDGGVQAWTDSLDGVKLPHYRRIIKEGRNACTSMTAWRQECRHRGQYVIDALLSSYGPDDPNYDCQTAERQVTAWGLLPAKFFRRESVEAIDETEANNKALATFVKRVRKRQTSFQGAIAAGETAETLRMLRNPVNGLRKTMFGYLQRLKKNRRKLRKLPPKRRRSAVSDTWLEQSFGWTPLLNDIDDAAQAVANSMYRSDQKMTVVTASGRTCERTESNYTRISNNGIQPYFKLNLAWEKEVIVKYQAGVDPGSYALYNPRRVGFDPSNWLPTAWELLPWSFLVDYFANVGEIVSAASLSRSSIQWMNKTVRKSGTYVNPCKWEIVHKPNTLQELYAAPPNFRDSVTLVTRTAGYNGTLIPDMEFSIPGTGGKWLNIAALLHSSKQIAKDIRLF